MGPRSRPHCQGAGGTGSQTTSGSRSALSTALELAADAVLLMDRSGRIQEATGAVSDILGRKPGALRGESVGNLCLPAARGRLIENLGRATRESRHLFSTQIIRVSGRMASARG